MIVQLAKLKRKLKKTKVSKNEVTKVKELAKDAAVELFAMKNEVALAGSSGQLVRFRIQMEEKEKEAGEQAEKRLVQESLALKQLVLDIKKGKEQNKQLKAETVEYMKETPVLQKQLQSSKKQTMKLQQYFEDVKES